MGTITPIHRNLRLINILSFLSELNFREGILMLFLSKYLSWAEIGLLFSLAVIVKTTFEIPTGIFADRHSRRISLFLSFIIFALGLFAIVISHNLIFATIAFILWGISDAFYSGSQESLLYDTLRTTGQEQDFGAKESERMAWFEGGIIFASISGGLLFDLSPNLPFLVMGIIYIFSAVLALFVIEPPKESSIVQSVSEYVSDLRSNIGLLITGKFLPKGLLYALLTLAVVVYITSELFDETGFIIKGLNGLTIGIIFSLTSTMSLIANLAYSRWKDVRVGMVGVGIFATLVASITGYLPIMLVAILIRCGLWAILEIRTKTILNDRIPSSHRTSLLSTFSFLSELPFVILSPLLGWGIDRLGYSPTLAGFVVVCGSILLYLRFGKNNATIKSNG